MGGGPGFGPWMAEQLNLTDAQKKQVDRLRASFVDKTKEAREQLIQDREALRALWQEPNPDKQAIKNLQASMDQLRNQIRDAGIDLHADMLKILTPEQQTKFSEFKLNHPRMGKKGKRGGGGPGMGGPGGPGMMGDCPFQSDNQ